MRIDNEFPRNVDFNINCQAPFHFDSFLWPPLSFSDIAATPSISHSYFSRYISFPHSQLRKCLMMRSLFPGSNARFMSAFFPKRTYPTVPGIDGPLSKVCPLRTAYSSSSSFSSFSFHQVSDLFSCHTHEARQKRWRNSYYDVIWSTPMGKIIPKSTSSTEDDGQFSRFPKIFVLFV